MLDGAAGAEPGTRSEVRAPPRPPGPGASPRPGPAPAAARSPVALQVGDARTELARPGVFVIDLLPPPARPLDLQEIVFKNFYTAFLTVRVLRCHVSDGGREGARKWVTCLRNHCLMPSPHTEAGSQDYFSLSRHQMLCDVDQVTAVRLILRQPSPVWLHFTLEELQLYPRVQQSLQTDFPSWLSHLAPQQQPANLHRGVPDPEKVSTEVQRLWVLTEMIRANQTAARIGRFDMAATTSICSPTPERSSHWPPPCPDKGVCAPSASSTASPRLLHTLLFASLLLPAAFSSPGTAQVPCSEPAAVSPPSDACALWPAVRRRPLPGRTDESCCRWDLGCAKPSDVPGSGNAVTALRPCPSGPELAQCRRSLVTSTTPVAVQ
ncbi:nicolin-1 isoform X2 [Pelodiscus sinensis]|uniref:nicolin-1 isoform X2 n=1 Tax=Pelodiscus sinensis TaxID=13735 RepID=UPI003F6B2A48